MYDVWADGHHLIAKEYLRDVELDAPLNEYRAVRLVESMDIAGTGTAGQLSRAGPGGRQRLIFDEGPDDPS